MKKQSCRDLWIGLCFLAAFFLWTVCLLFVDVQTIGPRESAVGFASLNGAFHKLTGVNMTLYHITDWLGLVPVAFSFGFAILGLVQWIKRRSICRVDYSLFILGGFYIIVFGAYLLFESVVINRRPVLIEGFLEASYPSSTTLLVLCVMPTTIMQFNTRLKSATLRKWMSVILWCFIAFMVIGRLLSGVHWLSDIIGGLLLSAGLVALYRSFAQAK